MKIAVVTPGGFSPDGRYDVIPALLALTAELARRHEVHVFAFGGPGGVVRYPAGGASVHLLGEPARGEAPPGPGERARRLLRGGAELWRELRLAGAAGRFDVLHAWWATDPGALACLFGRVLRVPVVVSVGGGEAVWLADIVYGGAGTRAGRARTAAVLRAAAAVTIGSDTARALLPGRARERAQVVPLGIDVDRMAAPPARAPGPPWRLLHVGSVNRVKDHRTLLAAFARVAARHGDVTLDCAGEDTLGGDIQAHARALGVDTRVRFRGFVPNDQVAALYRAAHLHVVSSRYESQSVAVLEAAAAGLPTVGTAVGLLPTLAALAPEAALTVPPGDAAGLADAICGLLADEPRRAAMGARAQSFAQTHDARFTANAFEVIYRRVARRADTTSR